MSGAPSPRSAAAHAPWRADPRARVVALVLVQCAAFVARGALALGLALGGAVLVAAIARSGPRRRLAAAVVGSGFLFGAILNALFVRGGEERVVLPLGLAITSAGLTAGLEMGLRMASLGAYALAFAFTTPAPAAAGAIGTLVAPLDRFFGSRVHTSTFQTEIAMRFVPFLAEEARRISVAQRFRGLRVGGSPLARVRAAAPLFVPVFAQAVLRADRLATLLAARGYRPGLRRRPPADARWTALDTALVLSAGAVLVAGIVLA